MKPYSADREYLPPTRSLGGWLRRVFARVRRRDGLQGMSRAEFEQVARDLDLSHPELYGLLTGRRVSADVLENEWAVQGPSPGHTATQPAADTRQISARAQALLPIGPSCC